MNEQERKITRLWRERGHGRLYWKRNNRRWRDWSRENIAQVRMGSLHIYFNSYEAIMTYLGVERE